MHVAATSWAGLGVNGQQAPGSVAPNADAGWREYGNITLSGAPIDVRTRISGYALREAEVAARFVARVKVFAAYSNGAGWDPQP